MQLELLPPDLAGRVRGLQDYEFASSARPESTSRSCSSGCASRSRKSWFDQMSDGHYESRPRACCEKDQDRLSTRSIGCSSSGRRASRSIRASSSSWSSSGTCSPATPSRSTSCSSNMAAQMAAMQAALDSMSPEQRAQLQQLAESLFEDMDLRWQVDRLGRQPAKGGSRTRIGKAVRLQRRTAVGLAEAAASARQLGDIDQLEQFLSPRRHPALSPRWTSSGPASCSVTTGPVAGAAREAGPRARGGGLGRPARRAATS